MLIGFFKLGLLMVCFDLLLNSITLVLSFNILYCYRFKLGFDFFAFLMVIISVNDGSGNDPGSCGNLNKLGKGCVNY